MKIKQDSPNAIQIELVEGCQLACSFCGIQGIRDNGANGPKKKRGKHSRPYYFMLYGDAKIIAKRIMYAIRNRGWNPRIEFAMHGEPTLHDQCMHILEMFRKYLPKQSFMMTSNGGPLCSSTNITNNINLLFSFGLNVLLIDDYRGIKYANKIRKAYKGPYVIYSYPMEEGGNPHRRRKPNKHLITIAADPTVANKGTHSFINNHAGCSFPPNNKMQGKRCAKPFREMSIRYDGNVAICCNDWRGIYKCGNVIHKKLDDIWQGVHFHAARVKLYHGERGFGPCDGCDAVSYRTGLLPDRMGKAELPVPDKVIEQTVAEAISGESYAEPVLRPWETKREPLII